MIEECGDDDDDNDDDHSTKLTRKPPASTVAQREDDHSCMDRPSDTTHNKLKHVFEDDKKNATQFIDAVVASNQELNCFSSLLNAALLQNDGALEVSDIGSSVEGSYTEDQIRHYLQQLCAQNKIMRTDDIIYSM